LPLVEQEVRDSERRFCFEIVSPQDSITVQAENEQEMREWITVIQNATAHSLNSQQTPRKAGAVDGGSNRNSNEPTTRHVARDLLYQKDANRFCADCNAPDPEWASINLGLLVCIECRY